VYLSPTQSTYNAWDLTFDYTPGDDSLLAINVAGVTFSSEDGSIDPGVSGVPGVHDPVDAIVFMTSSVVGVHELTVGGAWSDGMDVYPLAESTFTLTVIPEPGTALLLGLGLLGLASVAKVPRRWPRHPRVDAASRLV
jgi:hypothetical protein